jgi:hypothetical protein
MKNNQVFYNKEDLWEFPSEIYEDSKIPMESYYQVMHLPGHKNAEFSLMIPFTPRGKNNLVSLAAALSSRDKYGQILVYKMPKQKLTYGPMQFEARVDQDPDISKQLSLWSQKGSRVIRGNTLIIPIHSALLYIEPLYLKAEQSELPELKRIIVSLGSKMVMESSLSKALNLIFSSKVFLKDLADGSLQQAGFTDLDLNSSQKILIEKAKSLYKDARKMLKNGDLAGFAKKIDDLGNILEKL